MILRVATISAPGFRCGGLAVSRAWTPLVAERIGERQRKVLETYVGHLLRIHPDDAAHALPALGWALVDARLVPLSAEPAPPTEVECMPAAAEAAPTANESRPAAPARTMRKPKKPKKHK